MSNEIRDSIYSRLIRMRLPHMAERLQAQEMDPSYETMPFLERLVELIDCTEEYRNDRRKKRLVSKSHIPFPSADVSGIWYDVERSLDKTRVEEFATCMYIEKHHNIVIQGTCGSGKTYIASALASEACAKGFSVSYMRMDDLLLEGAAMMKAESFGLFLDEMLSKKLLIIDEMFSRKISEKELSILSVIVSKRHQRGSIIFVSQYSYTTDWIEMAPKGVILDSLLDRIWNNSYSLTVHSKSSMRTFEKPQ